VIYINGDSHSAGAELIKDYSFAEDDPRFFAWGKRAHPEAVPLTYGYKLAQQLNQPFFLEAESASSNDRIIRTTQKTISETIDKSKLFVIIGWATWEREEWQDGETYYQLTASGTDSVPEHMEEDYKQWVLAQTKKELDRKVNNWHNRLHDFHLELREQNIKHLFFNTYLHFSEHAVPEQKDWHNQYIDPYSIDSTYYHWLKNNGYQTVNGNSYHYGADAHVAWCKHILPMVMTQYSGINDLTNKPKRSIITKNKVQPFTGLKK